MVSFNYIRAVDSLAWYEIAKIIMKVGLVKNKEKDDYMTFEEKKLVHEVQRLG